MSEADEQRRFRLARAVHRAIQGARLSLDRTEIQAASAPMLHGQVRDFRNRPTNDVDYYAYDLTRLREVAVNVVEVWGDQTVADALGTFDAQVPHLREFRNPVTHPRSTDDRLDAVAWFDGATRLHPDGSVEYLVDPEMHQPAVEHLANALRAFLAPDSATWPAL